MESDKSGSFQSSSDGGGGAAAAAAAATGDEEYNSTTEPISSFLSHFNPNPLLQPPPSHHHQPPPTNASLFHPSTSSFSNPNPNPNPNPLYDLDSVWSRNMRPDPNFPDFGSTQTFFNSQQGGSYPNPSPTDSNTKPGTTKNPKKRTRASRRAPTTVLTTDTTNFRQMVQEFTGIPSTPFSAAFSHRRDLFGRGGDGGIGPLFPLRPSPQKIQQQPPSFLHSSANILDSGTSNNSNIAISTPASNFHLPPSDILGFPKQPQTLQDLQNRMLSFQTLLQTTLPQQSDMLNEFPSSSKKWRGQDENSGSFEGANGNNQNVGGYKMDSSDLLHQNEKGLVSSRNGGDQVQGNVDSWICPSD